VSVSRLALGQVNPTVGDFDGNVATMVHFAEEANERGAELLVFPEMAITGYPPYDLLERPSFVESNLEALDQLTQSVPGGLDVLVGYVEPNPGQLGNDIFNAAAYIRDNKVVSKHHKALLPTYDVFNEDRYFEPGGQPTLTGPDQSLGVTICEDIWNEPDVPESYDQPRYERNPFRDVLELHPQLMVNLSASPYVRGKDKYRRNMYRHLAREARQPLAVCNQVGGNDSLIFDGNSAVVDADGELVAQAASFEEDLLVVDLDDTETGEVNPLPDERESVYRALKRGLGDYLEKCGFEKTLVGLSGGIDSSLTATLAVDVLGEDNVLGVLMPSEISSESSVTDAEKLADNLGIETRTFPIQELFDGYLDLFDDEFEGLDWDTTEENLQARIRGDILMALSNKYGHILLSTGNKSELAVGYCTLYGDMNGGLAVLSDVPKTLVYELARYRNEQSPVIPENVLTKPPSAELAPEQKDTDSLPPYETLDEIIERYVEKKQSRSEMKEAGLDPDTVDEVVRMIDLNEYKRQQSPPGLKVTSKAFSAGRIMPIAQKFES
jgi:NAD+ synthase (glutamine-hydrolysing)